jgi:hypothetical protein
MTALTPFALDRRIKALEQQVIELRMLANRPVDVTEAMNDLIGNRFRSVFRSELTGLENRILQALRHKRKRR